MVHAKGTDATESVPKRVYPPVPVLLTVHKHTAFGTVRRERPRRVGEPLVVPHLLGCVNVCPVAFACTPGSAHSLQV